MAVIDALLGLVDSQRAQGIVIAADRTPELVHADGRRPLSMPAIPAETVAGIARDVAASPASGARYQTPAGRVFQVRVEGEGTSLRLTFSRAGADAAPPRPAAAAAPPAGATPEADRPADEPAWPDAEFEPAPDDTHVQLLDLLASLEREQASDLLVSSGLPPRLRAGGVLRALPGPIPDDAAILRLVAPALDDRLRRQLETRGSVDVALEPAGGGGARFRVNLFRQARGLAAALRPIRREPPRLADLNLPAALHELASYRDGLVLVTGPSGSGKSTTLVALTEELNRTASRHVVTLEDPIEYRYTPKRCLIHQREVGRDVDDFAGGLRAALREGPDVILVGEMRDRDTIAAALTAAETGHLVLSTLHSASPWMAIERMIDVFPGAQQPQVRTQLASVLRAVVSQHLLPSTAPPARVPAFEKLVVTPAVANQIRDDKIHQLRSTVQTSREDGMLPLEASLAELVRRRRVDAARARALARDPRLLDELIAGGAGQG
jgi:twitching motility protein PilT